MKCVQYTSDARPLYILDQLAEQVQLQTSVEHLTVNKYILLHRALPRFIEPHPGTAPLPPIPASPCPHEAPHSARCARRHFHDTPSAGAAA